MREEVVGRILRFPGYGAYHWEFDESASTLTVWVRQVGSDPSYTCSGCGIGSRSIHSVRERRVRDLPWGAWKVWLWLEIHRVYCRRCVTRSKKTQFQQALALNRRLFKAYYLKEQLERLWSHTYEGAAARFFIQWLLSLRWQRLPAFKKVARTLYDHFDGILNYCRHKVPFGVVEAINGNLRAVIRRGRGYRDHEYLLLKVQKSTAQARLTRAA